MEAREPGCVSVQLWVSWNGLQRTPQGHRVSRAAPTFCVSAVYANCHTSCCIILMVSLPDAYSRQPGFQMVRQKIHGSQDPACSGLCSELPVDLLDHRVFPLPSLHLSLDVSLRVPCLPSIPSLCVPHSTTSSQGRVTLLCEFPCLREGWECCCGKDQG